MIRMLIVGPPGSGKGTQAALISETFNIVSISTGDIFRKNIVEETSLGLAAQKYINVGEYVPDDITNDMIRDRFSRDDIKSGFLLDGYPRTLSQVVELDTILGFSGNSLDLVLEIDVPEDQLVQRVLKRAVAEGRVDDTEEIVRRRLEIFREETLPVLGKYVERDLLVKVSGVGNISDISERIISVLNGFK